MPTQATIDTKAAQSQELLQMILDLSIEEIVNLRRLFDKAERLKLNGTDNKRDSLQPRRFIDPEDGRPVWELDLIDEFDRESCYEDFEDKL